MLASGTVVDGRYRILRPLGGGGQGIVLEEHVSLGHRVAIKVLHPSTEPSAEDLARFEQEAHIIARLKSSFVVRVLEVGRLPSGLPWIAMERLRGESLASLLSRSDAAPADLTSWVIDICSALEEAHGAGIVHRDLKPSNVFLVDVGGRRSPRILDFGIAKDVRASLTRSHVSMGTPQYMAPEQLFDSRSVDARADVFAIGIILYRGLTKRFPFADGVIPGSSLGASPPIPIGELRPDLRPELADAIMRAISVRREDRFPSAKALAEALRPRRRPRTRLWPGIVAALVTIVLGGGLGTCALRRLKTTSSLPPVVPSVPSSDAPAETSSNSPPDDTSDASRPAASPEASAPSAARRHARAPALKWCLCQWRVNGIGHDLCSEGKPKNCFCYSRFDSFPLCTAPWKRTTYTPTYCDDEVLTPAQDAPCEGFVRPSAVDGGTVKTVGRGQCNFCRDATRVLRVEGSPCSGYDYNNVFHEGVYDNCTSTPPGK